MTFLPPYSIDDNILHFKCPLRELVTYKIEKDADGYVDYKGIIPEDVSSLVILAIETKDGLFVLTWEKK